MQLPQVLLLSSVIGIAAAHPSGHAHLHRSVHEKRDVPATFVKNVHRPIPAPSVAPKPAPEPVPEPSAAPAPAPDAAPKKDKGERKYKPFCSEGAASKSKRVTYDQIMYTGELGTGNNCKWNSNLMVVDSDIADMYDYVQMYTNVAQEKYQIRCANKMGPDGKLTGMFAVDGQEQLVFDLAPGETKAVVAQANTQSVCAFAPGEVPKTEFGQYAGNWIESDFGNASNGGWSGADCSSLVAQHYDMDVPGCQVCQGGICSTIFPGGKGENAYTKGMEALDGVGLNIPAGATTLDVKVGYSA